MPTSRAFDNKAFLKRLFNAVYYELPELEFEGDPMWELRLQKQEQNFI